MMQTTTGNSLPVAAEAEGVVLLPGRPARSVVVQMTLAQATVLLADTGKATSLATLVHGLRDPVDPGVAADSLVAGVNENDLVVFVDTVLVHPVRVEHTKVTAPPANTLLRHAPQTTLRLEVVNTLADGLAVGRTLGDVFLAVTPPHTYTVDDVALLGLVAKAASLVGAGWARGTVDDIELAVLPAPHAEEESEDIRLLFLVELANVLVSPHACELLEGRKSVSVSAREAKVPVSSGRLPHHPSLSVHIFPSRSNPAGSSRRPAHWSSIDAGSPLES